MKRKGGVSGVSILTLIELFLRIIQYGCISVFQGETYMFLNEFISLHSFRRDSVFTQTRHLKLNKFGKFELLSFSFSLHYFTICCSDLLLRLRLRFML